MQQRRSLPLLRIFMELTFGAERSACLEPIRELLVLLRYGEQFDADRFYGLASGQVTEPLSFALILRYPLRDRPR
jgi:hypothetical protein